MAEWIKAKGTGLRYREHPTKTVGVGRAKRPLRYYGMVFKWREKTYNEIFGWEREKPQGDKKESAEDSNLTFYTEADAERIYNYLRDNRRNSRPPFTLAECRRNNEEKIDAKLKEDEKVILKADEARRFTLGVLLGLYCDYLKKSGKTRSAACAASAFKVHVPDELANLPAKEITRPQITEIIRRVREKGKDRTAGILRAYLHAAYEMAMMTETNSAAPAGFIPFRVNINPVHGIKAIPVTPGERVLTVQELSDYLTALDDRPADIALKVALLAGGQRMEQLLRATPDDWDKEGKTLLLLDGKGKRTTPRKHLLPLAGKAAALVKQQAERAKAGGKALLFFSEQGGRIDPCTPGKRVKEIAKTMGGERFDLRDIRRTCETHLAKIGINQDTRAQLLSHGISGVQAKHYDRYSYLPEKLAALARWEDYLLTGGTPAEVIHLADRRAAR